MKLTELSTDLFCIRCKEDTSHKITYLNQKISKIECENCGKSIEIDIDVAHELYDELLQRITSKPSRITEEYKTDLGKFLLSIPKRVATKPLRVYKEVKELQKITKKYKYHSGFPFSRR